jgi:hypothetical protein
MFFNDIILAVYELEVSLLYVNPHLPESMGKKRNANIQVFL